MNTLGPLPYTPRLKRAVQFASGEALHNKRKEIEPEHLLLGLFRDCDGVAYQILESLSVGRKAMREEIAKLGNP